MKRRYNEWQDAYKPVTMYPVCFINKQNSAVMIMPDTLEFLNVLAHQTQTYHIYLQNEILLTQLRHKNDMLNANKEDNPNYLGCIVFQESGKLISFMENGSGKLSRSQVEDIIRHIHGHRQNPGIWLN